MNIVITGGAGFIGSHLSYLYTTRGDDVTIIDNLSTGRFPETDVYNKKFIQYDLSNRISNQTTEVNTIEKVIEKADLIYHLASSVGVKYVDADPKGTLRNSFDINNNLFPVFEKYNSRVIFASTSEVYGDTKEACETDTLKIGPTDTLRWGYACGKLMSEFLLKAYNFRSTVVRFFNVTGHGQLPDYGMVLPSFINRAKENKDLIVYGSGSQSRTLCDIRDAVKSLDILSSDNHIGQTYNIGNPRNEITIKQLANKVIDMTASSSNIIYKEHQEDFTKDHGEIYVRYPNIEKLKKYYTPHYSIQDIINSML